MEISESEIHVANLMEAAILEKMIPWICLVIFRNQTKYAVWFYAGSKLTQLKNSIYFWFYSYHSLIAKYRKCKHVNPDVKVEKVLSYSYAEKWSDKVRNIVFIFQNVDCNEVYITFSFQNIK